MSHWRWKPVTKTETGIREEEQSRSRRALRRSGQTVAGDAEEEQGGHRVHEEEKGADGFGERHADRGATARDAEEQRKPRAASSDKARAR